MIKGCAQAHRDPAAGMLATNASSNKHCSIHPCGQENLPAMVPAGWIEANHCTNIPHHQPLETSVVLAKSKQVPLLPAHHNLAPATPCLQ
jgi:hypothetical protein